MGYKIFKVTYNDGEWHTGELPHFYYIAKSEEELIANSTCYAQFAERQKRSRGNIWIREFNGIDYPAEWENLKDFNIHLMIEEKLNDNKSLRYIFYKKW